ncbi:MAG: OmpA family protein [Rickettsiales endosymbiont of Dermacentor nuttalli]
MKKVLFNVMLYIYLIVSVFINIYAFEYQDMLYNKPDVELHLEVLNKNFHSNRTDIAFPLVCKDKVSNKIEHKKSIHAKHHGKNKKLEANYKKRNVVQEQKKFTLKPKEPFHPRPVIQSKQDEKIVSMTVITPVETLSSQNKKEQNLLKTEVPDVQNAVMPAIVVPSTLLEPKHNEDIQQSKMEDKMSIQPSNNIQNMLPLPDKQTDQKSSIRPVSPVIPIPTIPLVPPVPSDLPKKTLLENKAGLPVQEIGLVEQENNKTYNINFEGGTKLLKDTEKTLNIIARELHDNNSKILKIIGYIKTEKEQDAETRSASLKRVIAIRNYLVDQGISSTRLMVQAGILSSNANIPEVEIQEMNKAKLN